MIVTTSNASTALAATSGAPSTAAVPGPLAGATTSLAATSAVAAKYLARQNARSMAIIGNGAQSEFQARAFKAISGKETGYRHDGSKDARRAAMPRGWEVRYG